MSIRRAASPGVVVAITIALAAWLSAWDGTARHLGDGSVPSVARAAQQPGTPAAGAGTPTTAAGAPTAQAGTPRSKTLLYAWVEFGPDGQIARVIKSGAGCPKLKLNGIDTDMIVRATGSHSFGDPVPTRAPPATPPTPAPAPDRSYSSNYDVTVCEAAIPVGMRSAWVEDRSLPLSIGSVDEIAVIGDTGCRLVGGAKPMYQSCDDGQQWPFGTIAQGLAYGKPDLVIHVGDYHYREAPCPTPTPPPAHTPTPIPTSTPTPTPTEPPKCKDSPWWFNWPAWEQDFFVPADPLLQASPWVFLRGNHEACGRAAEGWFRFLEPGSFPSICEGATEPYVIRLGDLQLVVVDSSERQARAEHLQQAIEWLAGDDNNTWLLIHTPLWVLLSEDGTPKLSAQDLPRTAIGDGFPAGIRVVLSGDTHLGEVLTFSPTTDRPRQIVIGNSGTQLDPAVTGIPPGTDLAEASLFHDFGHAIFRRVGGAWEATGYGIDGEVQWWVPITTGTIQDQTATPASAADADATASVRPGSGSSGASATGSEGTSPPMNQTMHLDLNTGLGGVTITDGRGATEADGSSGPTPVGRENGPGDAGSGARFSLWEAGGAVLFTAVVALGSVLLGQRLTDRGVRRTEERVVRDELARLWGRLDQISGLLLRSAPEKQATRRRWPWP